MAKCAASMCAREWDGGMGRCARSTGRERNDTQKRTDWQKKCQKEGLHFAAALDKTDLYVYRHGRVVKGEQCPRARGNGCWGDSSALCMGVGVAK
jgi:hypothetical protein